MSGKGGRANPLESPFIDHWLLVVTLSLVSALLFLLLLPLVNQAFHWHLLAIHPLTIAIALFVVTTICLLPVMRSKDENSQLGYFGVALVTLIVLCICLAKLAIQTLFDIILFFIWPFEAIKITCLFSVLFLCRRYYMKCFSSE